MMESMLVAENRECYFGEGCGGFSAVEMRRLLQKDEPHLPYTKNSQIPHHLSELACGLLGVKLTNYRVVLGSVGDIPYTEVNDVRQ